MGLRDRDEHLCTRDAGTGAAGGGAPGSRPAGAPLVSCWKNVLLAGIWQPGLWRGGKGKL